MPRYFSNVFQDKSHVHPNQGNCAVGVYADHDAGCDGRIMAGWPIGVAFPRGRIGGVRCEWVGKDGQTGEVGETGEWIEEDLGVLETVWMIELKAKGDDRSGDDAVPIIDPESRWVLRFGEFVQLGDTAL